MGNKAVVQEFFDSITAGEFDRAAELVEPTGRWNMPRRGITYTLAEQVRILREENMTFAITELTAEENRVSALVSGYMTRPNGDRFDKSYHFLITVDGDHLVDVDMYDDGGLAERIVAEVAPATRGSDPNTQLARAFFAAISNSRFADAAALLTPDATWWSAGRRAERPARAELDRIRGRGAEGWGDSTFAPGPFLADGDRVAVQTEGRDPSCVVLRFAGPFIAQLWMYGGER